MTKVCGIDPGKKGAFALSDTVEGLYDKVPMPESTREIVELLGEWKPDIVYLERLRVCQVKESNQCSIMARGMGLLKE